MGVPGTPAAPSTYCCTPELHARGTAGCERVGSIVVSPSRLGTDVFRHDLQFSMVKVRPEVGSRTCSGSAWQL